MDKEIPAVLVKHVPGIIDNWDKVGSYFKKEEIPAKRILLREGDLAKRIYFIESGCIRLFFTDMNKDVTVQFFFEDLWTCSIESFLENKPSKFSLETLEKGTYYILSRDNYLRLTNELPQFDEHFKQVLIRRMYHYLDSLLDYIRFSPEQRYNDLLQNHPEILRRIPQYYIASYLGITSVSFSRIRNRK